MQDDLNKFEKSLDIITNIRYNSIIGGFENEHK